MLSKRVNSPSSALKRKRVSCGTKGAAPCGQRLFSVATHEHMCDTATGEKACGIGGVGFGLRFEAEDGEENDHQESRQVHL